MELLVCLVFIPAILWFLVALMGNYWYETDPDFRKKARQTMRRSYGRTGRKKKS